MANNTQQTPNPHTPRPSQSADTGQHSSCSRKPPLLLNQTIGSTTNTATLPTISAPAAGKPRLPSKSIATNTASNARSASAPSKMSMAAALSPTASSSTSSPPVSTPPLSMTSKEWVIPPRPKPGRKPATDTPPTKRKAQNRAAQRAFRERRAARIGELEDQLEEQKEDHEKEERGLFEKIEAITREAEELRGRCLALEGLLASEKKERARVEEELNTWRRSNGVQQSDVTRDETQMGSGHLKRQDSLAISQIITPPDQTTFSCGSCDANGSCACAEAVLATTVVGCGNCTLGSRCECLEAELAASSVPPTGDLKRLLRSPSPTTAENKRQRSDIMEIDFTASFGRIGQNVASQAEESDHPPVPAMSLQPSHSERVQSVTDKDGCGFCKDGTYCVCADAAMSLDSTAPAIPHEGHSMAHQDSQMTPPPSDGDVVFASMPVPMEIMANGAVRLPVNRNRQQRPAQAATGCGAAAGPGTCAQCLADPKSGLFCRSLAATFSRTFGPSNTSAGSGGCCGNGGPGGCCKSTANTSILAPVAGSSNGNGKVTLTCADTYSLLATHRHFDQAADQIGTWLPLLKAGKTTAAPAATGSGAGAQARDAGESERLPIEVEAASIMGVLKTFDVRFGK